LGYEDLTDEDKLEEAIRFVAAGQPLPEKLKKFLQENALLDLVTNPQEV
jgi:hypothetical protein